MVLLSVQVFQSLSGFFRPCNLVDVQRQVHRPQVSIPVGFFQALQLLIASILRTRKMMFQSLSGFFRPCNTPEGSKIARAKAVFQSLSGFFRPCNSHRPSAPARPPGSFNPCRVFSGLATGLRPELHRTFQPVSIPVGFFQALQRVRPADPLVREVCFNPCRVFSGLATPSTPSP